MATRAGLNGRLAKLEAQAARPAAAAGDDWLATLAAMEPAQLNLLTQNMLIAIGPPVGEEAAAIYRRVTAPGATADSAAVEILLAAYGDVGDLQNHMEIFDEDFSF